MAESVSIYGGMNYGEAYYGTAIREAFITLLDLIKQDIDYIEIQPLILTPIDILNISTTKIDSFNITDKSYISIFKDSIETFHLNLESTYILRLWLYNEPDNVDISVNNWTVLCSVNNWNITIISR